MDNCVGKKNGDMLVIKQFKSENTWKVKIKCVKCGREKETSVINFKNNKGISHKSCGKHIKFSKHFHSKWLSMRRRTTNPNTEHYKEYGGRGINSDVWKYFVDFYDDMYESYLEHVKEHGEKETTLDRIDVNGNYCKENCRWATQKEQCGNRRNNKTFKAISPEGKIYFSKNKTEFAKINGLSPSKIGMCIRGERNKHKGWKFEVVNDE